ncbi:right-handed parallel beta-helix repeat-containing protein [bacterium]|nr:right-handed parallel beta-helix repeat-containing protein [bacterium]
MKQCLRAVAIFSLILAFSPNVGAFTTPGTGVNWDDADLAANSGGVIVWDADNQRYVSSETITVAVSDTVSIVSDFEVNATGVDEDFLVEGMLSVGDPGGAPTDSVFMYGDITDGFGGFRVADEPDAHLILTRVVLSGGGESGVDDGVRQSGGEALIQGCRISNWPGYAARTSGGHMTIRNTLFHDNLEYTIATNLTSTLTMVGDTLVRNNMSSPASGKTAITVGTQGENSAIIDSCYISGTPGNRQGGIAVWNLLGSGQHATISNTTIEDCAWGITVQGSDASAIITDCRLINNTAYDNPQISGSGISVYPGGTVEAAYNEISGNWWGITIPGAGSAVDVTLGETGATEYSRQGRNRIFDNVNNDETWALFNNDIYDILAQENYWGATDSTEIAATIYDYNDDPSKGTVTFMPFWDGEPDPQPPVLVSVEPDSDSVNVWNEWFVRFSVSADDPDGDNALLAYQWNVDGTDWGTDTSIVVQFTGTGMIPVQVTVTDEQDLTVQRNWTVILNGESDLMTATLVNPDTSDVNIVTGETIEFAADANSPSGESLVYWYWLDGDISSQDSPTWSHTFAEEGEFTVTATLQDTVGNPWPAVSTSWTVHVSENSVAESGLLPAEFSLATYPNPFNAELRMRYSLPHAANLRVGIYDVLGRKVRTMTRDQVSAGQHDLVFDASTLASGLYFVQFRAGEWQVSRKVVLVR